jgi:hypothetical protein
MVLAEKMQARFMETYDVASARSWACPRNVELIEGANGAFTVLGPRVAVIAMLLWGEGLDGELYDV